MICVLLAVILVGSAGVSRGDTLGAIMPVGDSITDGDHSYNLLGFRDDLESLLGDLGIAFSYVGDTDGQAGDPRYPGHMQQGAMIEQFYPSAFGNGWGNGEFDIGPALQDLHPDVLLIHLGTNNVASPGQTPLGPYSYDGGLTLNRSYAGYVAELIRYITMQYTGYPAETPLIVLCQIIPILGKIPEVMEFNEYLEEMVLDMASGQVTGQPVHIVLSDQFGPFIENPLLFTGIPGDPMYDALHPNDAGYGLMAHSYLDALLDATPPAAVTNLTVWGQGPHSVRVWWTVTGDDYWSGTAAFVTFRVWDEPITDDVQFASAWELMRPMAASPPGTVQQLTAGGLPGGMTYWLALTVTDDAGNTSGVSNSPWVTLAAQDSVIDGFEDVPPPGVWDLGESYHVDRGQLRPAGLIPTWLPPAVFVGELEPWGAELTLPSDAPASETARVGLVTLAEPSQDTDGFVLRCSGGNLELCRLESGVLGAVVDTAVSRFGALAPGARLGAFPFVFEGALLVRAVRDGMPDRILSTGMTAQSLPVPRCAGIIMQGALGWGVDSFRLEGPGLWEHPEPFHLISPDSGAVTSTPPWLVWQSARDGDPWDRVAYEVFWSHDPCFPEELTYRIPCGTDTTVLFPADDYAIGLTYYWRVRAEDSTGLESFSMEDEWSFLSATGADGHPHQIRIGRPVPNPSAGTIRVVCEIPEPSRIQLELYDLGGRCVARYRGSAGGGEAEICWTIPREVAPGAYVLTVLLGTAKERFPVSIRR